MNHGELRVTGTSLHLDARRRSACAFVSHAHGNHIGRHERTIATAPTLALMRHRLGEPRRRPAEALPATYRSPFGLGELTLELFAAGHVLGSAQLRITRDGVSVGYTGDLCTDPTYAAEPADVMPCDVLVLESTFGQPRYVFPPKSETLEKVRAFVDNAFSDGVTPVLLGYALGKAQEILKFLSDRGYRCRAHPTVHALNRVYRSPRNSSAERATPRPRGGRAGRGRRSSPTSRTRGRYARDREAYGHPDRMGSRRRSLGSVEWMRLSHSRTTRIFRLSFAMQRRAGLAAFSPFTGMRSRLRQLFGRKVCGPKH